ncbi:MAG: pentapeptide repeat-containing protein [Myxococcota bacterium]|nr:pentapeptide repeat-containing protein [Myxococcota bacterium]
MTNLLELLEAGQVDEFNDTRSHRSAPNLFAADLAGKDLRGVDFSGVNLEKADLTGADLRGSVLARANFSGADLTGVRLEEVVAIKSRWTEAWLEEAQLEKADFTGADLVGAVLNGANGAGMVLRGARLKNAEVTEAVFTGADLRESKATGADFSGTDLSDAAFMDARFKGADFTRATLARADMTGAQGTGASLNHADMRGARLARADMTEADFGGAKLQGADLTRADLAQAAFIGADLAGTNLSEARLDDAQISEEQLAIAVRDDASKGEREAPDEICLGDVQSAVNGDQVAILWENDSPSDKLALCVSVFNSRVGNQRDIRVLPLPADLVLARALVATQTGFLAFAAVERPSGVVLSFTEIGVDGELGSTTVHDLEYELAVAPVLVADGDGVLVYGLGRRGPGLFVHRWEAGSLDRLHAEETPTARGFVGTTQPVVVTKGGLLMKTSVKGVGDAVTCPSGYPGRTAGAVPFADGLGLVWLQSDSSGLKWSLQTNSGVQAGCVDGDREISGLDAIANSDGVLVVYTREQEGEMSPMGAWGCQLPGGSPFPLIADASLDVDHVQLLDSGKNCLLLCQTLEEELLVFSLEGESASLRVRFP